MTRNSSAPSSPLAIRQLDKKFKGLDLIPDQLLAPKQGWLKTLREALGMTLRQAAANGGTTHQAVAAVEAAEAKGTVTLNTLKNHANNIECRLVYILIPHEGTLDATLRKQAHKIAKKILLQTAHTMALEEQTISKKEIKKQIDDMVDHFLSNISSDLWEE